ncbi:DUF6470 family protein [Pectinatus cerevisiiphilus]|uniref:Uncharacterized protein n=1 Tax=Pectinatus cerevisiiphilus TaxID=86956 RepID=A0A4R3K9I1_9FIRM|nr:DUF6470 family protein [Pectinatus cerevisiiphilus]TCS79640.1 hypothetical protein EDC37_10655 [Pectinatus cerevisiiphilus]
MLQLNIRTTNFILGMKADPGKVDPNMPEPTSKGKYEAPKNNLKIIPVSVKINSTAARESLGLYTVSALGKKLASQGAEGLSEGIARRMREGREVRNNGPLTNVLADISRENMMPKQVGLTVSSMPAPQITVTPSKIEGTIDPGISTIEITPGKYTLQYLPAKVNISVKQYASVKMWTTQNNYDAYA